MFRFMSLKTNSLKKNQVFYTALKQSILARMLVICKSERQLLIMQKLIILIGQMLSFQLMKNA